MTGLVAGTYSVTVTDHNGCTTPNSATITQPDALIASDEHTGTCAGSSDGSVTITFSGGTGPYQINFNGGGFVTQTSPKAYSNLAAGLYTWVVKDDHGCTVEGSETVNEFPLPQISCSATGPIDITSLSHSSQLDVIFGGGETATDYNYFWTTDGAGSLSDATLKNPVYTAAVIDVINQPINFHVTVTHKTTQCASESDCSVGLTGAAGCPTVETVPVCSGTTNNYNASVPPAANETWVWSANNGATINAPNGNQSVSVTAGSTSFTLKLTKSFANPDLDDEICDFEVTVNQCGGFCTYTQGKYGNGSPACDNDGTSGTAITYPTVVDMIKALLGVGGVPNPLYIGGDGITKPRITIPATATAAVLLNASMPGGSTARELWGNCTVESPAANCWKYFNGSTTSTTYITKQGRINNVLLSQTITLGLNMRISSDLPNFALQAGTFATAGKVGGCGSTTPKVRSCYYNPVEPYNLITVNEYTYKSISQTVIDALNCKTYPLTVAGLFHLANDALGNIDGTVGTECGASLSNINNAVSAINEGFDECRVFIGWNVGSCVPDVPARRIITSPVTEAGVVDKLSISAYPNPFRDRVSFVIASPVSGQASLEVYNIVGQKLQTVYKGYITAGRSQVFEYKSPSVSNSTLIYKFRVGNKEVTGKLVNISKE